MTKEWTVTYNKAKHVFKFDAAPTLDEFGALIFSTTELPPERQKIVLRGKKMESDEDLKALFDKKKKAKFALYGTDAVAAAKPKEKILFIEDMTNEQRAEHKVTLPCGLENLGNTCFLNSTVQALRACPDFVADVKKWKANAPPPAQNAMDPAPRLAHAFAQDLTNMDKTEDAYEPSAFVSTLRRVEPQFAETSQRNGAYMQHDADEFMVKLLQNLNKNVTAKGPDGKDANIIDHYFKGQYEVTMTCDVDDAKEEPQTKTEDFVRTQCFIDRETVDLVQGIRKKQEEKVELRSEVMGTNVPWTKKSTISKLPKYLIVQMMRFFWKAEISKSAKIRKKVAFPTRIDVKTICSEKLQEEIDVYRLGKDKILEDRQAAKEAALKKEADKEKARAKAAWEAKLGKGKKKDGDKAMDVDEPSPAPKGDDKKEATEKDEEMKEPAKVELIEKGFAVKIMRGVGPAFIVRKGDKVKIAEDPEPWTVDKVRAEEVTVDLKRGDRTKNALPGTLEPAPEASLKKPTGWYRIVGLVTHKGQSAAAGHYIGYAREPDKPAKGPYGEKLPARWLKFDDDRTTVVDDSHVKQLYGGTGDMQMGYLCVYAECEPWEEDSIRV